MARRFHQGRYRPINPSKYVGDIANIVYRSSWERRFLHWCDLNPSVLKYNSEEIVIPYWSEYDQKMRRYFVDFVIQLRMADGMVRNFLIEIKPSSQCSHPGPRGRRKEATWLAECATWSVNQDKWKAATEWAKKNGMEFRVLTEYDIGVAKRPVMKKTSTA